MGKIAFIFPGQGAQKVGMGKDFFAHSAASRAVFAAAEQQLGFSVADLCFTENDRLDVTEYTQVAMLTVATAILREIEHRGHHADVTAGLSLGEYCALVATGAVTFEAAVAVVRQRGILMQEAVPAGVGGMAAVLGLSGETVAAVVNDIDGVTVANYNCPGQVVISGVHQGVEQALVQLKEAGARRTVMLNVSGPFHSQMLTAAGEQLGKVLAPVTIKNPVIPYVANVTAMPVNTSDPIKSLLQQQVCSSVKWQQSVEGMIRDGVDRFVEIGPGRTLTAFVRKISREVRVCNVETWEDLAKIASMY